MKRYILTVIIVISFYLTVYSGDKTNVIENYYSRDTLTTTIDTIQTNIGTAAQVYQRWVFEAYTSAGADTVSVFTKSKDGQFWIQRSLTNQTTGAVVTTAIISTTPQSWIINDSDIRKVLLVSPSDDESTVIYVIGGKKY